MKLATSIMEASWVPEGVKSEKNIALPMDLYLLGTTRNEPVQAS
jgi:hypothetical protein